MHQKKEDLEELSKRIEEEKELGDFYEERFLDNKSKGDEARFYFCRANQYRLLLQKTQEELDALIPKFDFHSWRIFWFSLAKFGYYRKSIRNIKQKLELYSTGLRMYEEKRNKLYETKPNDPSL